MDVTKFGFNLEDIEITDIRFDYDFGRTTKSGSFIVKEKYMEPGEKCKKAHEKKSAKDVGVTRIIYSGNKTIVLWTDNTKTVVACSENETYDEFDGFTAALAKKIYGSTCAVKREIRKKSTNQNKKQEVAENN